MLNVLLYNRVKSDCNMLFELNFALTKYFINFLHKYGFKLDLVLTKSFFSKIFQGFNFLIVMKLFKGFWGLDYRGL